jgi:hypothetical protein
MKNLLLHCHHEKRQEIDQKNRPENGDINSFKEGQEEREKNGLHCAPPRLELGKPTNKRPELVILIKVIIIVLLFKKKKKN